MTQDTLAFLLIYWNMSYYFWMITWMKNLNNFQITSVTYKSVGHVKECVIDRE